MSANSVAVLKLSARSPIAGGHDTCNQSIGTSDRQVGWLRRHESGMAVLFLLWGLTAVTVLAGTASAGGHFTYALDDAYIHLAMARNFAEHGVWGITPYEFTASSSSPLWTALLAALYRVGLHGEWLPLALAVICASLTVLVAEAALSRISLGRNSRLAVLLLLVLGTPMVPLICTGMEHSLQVLVCVGFLIQISRWVGTGQTASDHAASRRWSLILAPLLTSVRYEGLALIAIAAGFLLARWRGRDAALLVLYGAVPVLAVGLYSLNQGSMFLPDSVMSKSRMYGNPWEWMTRMVGWKLSGEPVGVSAFFGYPHLLPLGLGALAAWFLRFRARRDVWDPAQVQLFVVVLALVAHVCFAKMGQFHRYEAYLSAMAIVSTGPVFAAELSAIRWGSLPFQAMLLAMLFAILTAAPLLGPAWEAHVNAPLGMRNVHEQQGQTGRFLRTYYQGQGVVANDIGFIDYAADLHLLDLAGLASVDIMRANRAHAVTPRLIEGFAQQRNARIAALYESWSGASLPPTWTKLAAWTISDNVVCGSPTVTIYAVRPEEVDRLREALLEFEPSLPPTVRVRYF